MDVFHGKGLVCKPNFSELFVVGPAGAGPEGAPQGHQIFMLQEPCT